MLRNILLYALPLAGMSATLSDTKEAELQSKLFTEDGRVTTMMDGKVLADLKGRQAVYNHPSRTITNR